MNRFEHILAAALLLAGILSCASPGVRPEEAAPPAAPPFLSPAAAPVSPSPRLYPGGRPSLPQPGPMYPEYRPLPPPLTVPPRSDRNRGAVNPFTGEFYPPSGRGVINPWTGEYYPPAGNGFFNPRTGQWFPRR